MKKPHRFWDKMAGTYDKQVEKEYAHVYRDIIELSKKYINSGTRALDFGCGTGITTIELAPSVDKIIAIDTSRRMIEEAKIKSYERNIDSIDFSMTDIFDPAFSDKKYDAVFAFNILHFIKDIDSLLHRFEEMLTPSGIFISVTDCLGEKTSLKSFILSLLSKPGIIPFMKFYTMKELEETIQKNGFDIIEKKNLFTFPPNFFIVSKKSMGSEPSAGKGVLDIEG